MPLYVPRRFFFTKISRKSKPSVDFMRVALFPVFHVVASPKCNCLTGAGDFNPSIRLFIENLLQSVLLLDGGGGF